MSGILVLYGTSEGHTARVAAAIADELRANGTRVDVFDAGESSPDPTHYAGVIVAASVHVGRYQRAVKQWLRRHAPTLHDTPGAFVSVCLGVLQHDPKVQDEVAAIATRFLAQTGWRPTFTTSVAGALPYTRYGWFKRWLMKRIVAKAGGDTDTSRDYEYTDWASLRTFARHFGEVVEGNLEVG